MVTHESVYLRDQPHLLVLTIAEEWSREPGTFTRDEIAARLFSAFWRGEFKDGGFGNISYKDGSHSDGGTFVPIERELLFGMADGTLHFGYPGIGDDIDTKARRRERSNTASDRDLAWLASQPWRFYERLRQQSPFLRAYVDGAALTRRALLVWCARLGTSPPHFWTVSTDVEAAESPSSAMVSVSHGISRADETIAERDRRWHERFAQLWAANRAWTKEQTYNCISEEEFKTVSKASAVKQAIIRQQKKAREAPVVSTTDGVKRRR